MDIFIIFRLGNLASCTQHYNIIIYNIINVFILSRDLHSCTCSSFCLHAQSREGRTGIYNKAQITHKSRTTVVCNELIRGVQNLSADYFVFTSCWYPYPFSLCTLFLGVTVDEQIASVIISIYQFPDDTRTG